MEENQKPRKHRPNIELTLNKKEELAKAFLSAYATSGNKSMAEQLVARQFKIPRYKVKQNLSHLELIKKGDIISQEVKQEIEKELINFALKDKAPVLENIVSLTLNNIQEFLVKLSSDQEMKSKLTVRDVKDLGGLAINLNEVLRLELGKPTQRVESIRYSYNELQVVLNDLRKIDPVFEYPALEGENEENTNP